MNKVLVAVDSSKGSRACVAVCVQLFADRPPTTAVILVHVVQYGGPAAEYKAELIIIGNTRSLIDKRMMGDVARQVASAATVSVLLAR